jgi:hypothetical protein
MKEKCVKWSDCVEVCTAAACVMAGNTGGLQALIKRSAPEAMWTYCMIHRESPPMNELCPELSEVMDTVQIYELHKHLSTGKQTSCKIVQGNGEAPDQSLLFYCNSCWLSRGNIVDCVYNLRVAAELFLEEETLVNAEHFISKLVHLSDIF